MADWSRRLDPPIVLPEKRVLRTLKDAAEYVLEQPAEMQAEPAWQHAAQCLRNAAEREIAWMWFARPAMMRAILGPDKPPIGQSRPSKAERFKAKRVAAKKNVGLKRLRPTKRTGTPQSGPMFGFQTGVGSTTGMEEAGRRYSPPPMWKV